MTEYQAPDEASEFDAPVAVNEKTNVNSLALIIAVLSAQSDLSPTELVEDARLILSVAQKAAGKPKGPKVGAPRKRATEQPPAEILEQVGKRVTVQGWTERRARGGVEGQMLGTAGVVTGYCRRLGHWELVVQRDGANLPTTGVPLDRVSAA